MFALFARWVPVPLVLAPTCVATPWHAGQLLACPLIMLVLRRLRLEMSEAVRVEKVASGVCRSGCFASETQRGTLSMAPRAFLSTDVLGWHSALNCTLIQGLLRRGC